MSNTQENNKTIAEFIGNWNDKCVDHHWQFPGVAIPELKRADKNYYNSDLMFNISWDWLMPVVDAINNTGKSGGIKYALFDAIGNADLERAYNAVIEFIIWYNKQSN